MSQRLFKSINVHSNVIVCLTVAPRPVSDISPCHIAAPVLSPFPLKPLPKTNPLPASSVKSAVINLSCKLSNVRSIASAERLQVLHSDMLDNQIDLHFVTESFLSPSVPDSLSSSSTLHCLRFDRRSPNPKGKGGGVAVFARKDIQLVEADSLSSQFYPLHHCEIITVDLLQISCRFVLVYCPPSTSPAQSDVLFHNLSLLLSNSYRFNFLLGDFNYPQINWSSDNLLPNDLPAGLESLMSLSDLTQIVDFPTRTSHCGAENFLDLVFCNKPQHISKTVNLPPFLLSDHSSVLFETILPSISPPSPILNTTSSKRLDYTKCDVKRLLDHLCSYNWPRQLSFFSTVDSKLAHFSAIFNELVVLYTPTVRARRPTFSHRKPKVFRFIQRRNPSLPRPQLKLLVRRQLNRVKRARAREELSIINNKNPKELFHFVKSRLRPPHCPISLLVNGTLSSDASELANEFSSVFQEAFSPPRPPFSALPAIAPFAVCPDFSPINIAKHIGSLPSKVGFSPDFINFLVIKKCSDAITIPLSLIFQESFSSAKFPEIWKHSVVSPIFKKGSKYDANNYRPITLTHALSRLFERLILEELKRVIGPRISPNQYGFVSKRSCVLAVLESTSRIQKTLANKQQFVDVIYFDFRKAFDTVPHNLLLLKMRRIGIDERCCVWFESFLSNRSSNVKVNGLMSTSEIVVKSGVPQGSVTGPFLFLIYINDLLGLFPPNVHVTAFADDLKITGSDPLDMQRSIEIVEHWCDIWRLKLAENKTAVMHYGKRNPKTVYLIKGSPITPHRSFKDLGILVDDQLQFDKHINLIAYSAKLKSRQILKTFQSKNPFLYFRLFDTYIRPVLEYGCELFDPSNATLANKLESPFRYFTGKVIQRCNMPFNSYTDRLCQFSMLTTLHRRTLLVLRTYHKIAINSYHFPSMSSYILPSHSNRAPYLFKINGQYFDCFLHRNLSMWNRVCKVINSKQSGGVC
uniref:Reverse transcriptase n=1 Tax=Caenorhabditis briggsae TaxID=6238 RepID=Q4F8Q1_CAEBR|nr:reverse transcriptase [Caenorhabditis briggsae]